MNLVAQAAKQQLNKRITPKIEKILLLIVLLGFIVLSIFYLPGLFNYNKCAEPMMLDRSIMEEVQPVAVVVEPFDYKEFGTWFIGIINTLVFMALGVKKLLGKV